MSDRDELIEAGARALPRYGAWKEMAPLDIAAVVIDAVEPILRAQVEALLTVPPNSSALGHRFSDDRLIWRSDVLALLPKEEGSDD